MKLKSIDPGELSGKKESAKKKLKKIQKELTSLQELLFSEHKRGFLIVLQGMDTSGKDGVIKRSFSGFNPQGVRVVPFKSPTRDELDHDFLWRIHKQVPAKGEVTIFNRSYYEDVLSPRVHGLIDEKEAQRRYGHIHAFEKLLIQGGTTILKFFLHISKDEQRERLQARIDNPSKNWKISENDLKERLLWDNYMGVYEEVINATNFVMAPWFIIPSDHEWFRNLQVARITLQAFRDLGMKLPEEYIGTLKGVIVK